MSDEEPNQDPHPGPSGAAVQPVPIALILGVYLLTGTVLIAGPLVRRGLDLRHVFLIVTIEPLHSGVGLIGLLLMGFGLFRRTCGSLLAGCCGMLLWVFAALLRST